LIDLIALFVGLQRSNAFFKGRVAGK
jgi:hypothetical protein